MKKLHTILFFTLVTMMIFSCKKDEESETKLDKNGLTKDITNFVADSIIQKMKDLGMPIYGGENPPLLVENGQEVKFFINNFTLINSNVPEDYPNKIFSNLFVYVKNQDNNLLTISYKSTNEALTSTSVGRGSYIVGNNNKFTIFVDIQNVKEGTTSKADLVYVISGEYSAEGISNLYYANFMLNDYGDVNNIYIGNSQGRVIHDADGFSEFQ
jgi:hypothetical protein